MNVQKENKEKQTKEEMKDEEQQKEDEEDDEEEEERLEEERRKRGRDIMRGQGGREEVRRGEVWRKEGKGRGEGNKERNEDGSVQAGGRIRK